MKGRTMKQGSRVDTCEKIDRIKHRIVQIERDLRELADARVILTCYYGTLYDAEFDQRKVALLAELKRSESALHRLESQATDLDLHEAIRRHKRIGSDQDVRVRTLAECLSGHRKASF
jgi:hypothetical protein